jgi:predicted nucleotidyltransferase
MHTKLSSQILQTIVDRVVATANPKKIILFGSAQKGNMGPNSDLDILVVMPPGIHRRKTARSIYRNLIGVGFATDIIVVTEEDIEQYKDNIGFVIKPALEEGKVLYAA